LETADIVLMSDNLRNIPFAISIGRYPRTVIWQNLSIALSVIVVLVISALGFPCRCPLALLVMKAARCSSRSNNTSETYVMLTLCVDLRVA
jgi:cation transport ATPase